MKTDPIIRRTVSFLLTLCLVLSMVPTQALASGTCTCTDRCSFSAPNSACTYCSAAEESAFRCSGTLPSAVSAGALTRTYGSGLEETFALSITGGSGKLTIGYDKTYTLTTSGSTVTVRWSDVLSGQLNAGSYFLNYSFTPDLPDYRPSSGRVSFTVTKAPVSIGTVSYTGPALLDSTAPGDVVLTRQDTAVPGTLKLTVSRLTAGTGNYTWRFDPTDGCHESTSGTVTLTVAHDWTTGSCTEPPSCKGCGETDGTAPGHSFTYSANGAVITEKCSTPGYEHQGTLKLELASGASTEYTGSQIKPLKLTYSDSWAGPRDLTVTYANNVQIGTATGSVTVGGATAKLTFQITPSSMDVSAPDQERTYDGKEHTVTVTAPQGAQIRYGTKSGSYTLTQAPSYSDAGSYTIYYQVTKENCTAVEGSVRLTILPAALTVRAKDAEKTYGEADPAQFGWEIVSGKLMDGDSLTGITVSRASGENAGTYAITPKGSGTGNKNYSITYSDGTFTVLQREITITWSDLELTYNGTEQAPKAAAGNTAFGDKLELTVSGGQTDATKGQKVTARVTGITGEKARNYTLPKEVSAQFEIKKATMEEPRLRYTDETVDGKNDGTILDVTEDMEYRREDQERYTAITGTKVEDLAPGEYYIRYAESDNCYVSADAIVVIGQGRKLKITVPNEQFGYELTVDHAEVSYGGSAVLRFTLQEDCEKTEDFALKVNGKAVTLKSDGTCELKDIQEDLTVTVEGVADAEAPTAQIRVGNRVWKDFLTGIRFNIYYDSEQTVTITAKDEGSGVDKIHYYLAPRELTVEQLEAVYNWKAYTAPFTIRPDNKYVIYVRVTDKTGNVNYINSDGIIWDELQPDIDGVKARGVYYTTQKVTASDNFMLVSFKLDGSTFDGTISGDPSVETKHTLTAWDAAGNSTTVTITMMPISSLGEGLPQEDRLTLEDEAAIREVLETVQNILEKECRYATAREKQALEELEQKCQALLTALEAPAQVAELLEALPDPLITKPDDKEAIDALDAAQEAYDALSDSEKEMLGARAAALDALRKALTAYEITQGDNSKWTAGETADLSFTANGHFGKFRGVEVDGKTLDPENYTAQAGPTVVTLRSDYLETLDTGKHTVRILYTDGETEEATFRISQPIRLANAGTDLGLIGVLFWATLGLACLVAVVLIVLLILWRKEKE